MSLLTAQETSRSVAAIRTRVFKKITRTLRIGHLALLPSPLKIRDYSKIKIGRFNIEIGIYNFIVLVIR